MKHFPGWFYSLIACAAILAIAASAAAQVRGADPRYPERSAADTAADPGSPRAVFTVAAGQSIQSAVDRAQPGDRIEILPGVYHESVLIERNDIQFVGVIVNGERPVLDGQMQLDEAVQVSGDDFYIANIEMRNYKSNGIVVSQAKNVRFINLVGDNTGKYAIYPVKCDGVLVDGCVVSNVWDAGIYAGQSRNVTLRNSEAFNCTIGFEAENCVNVLIANNTAHNNSLGILVVLLPDLPTETATDARVINNRVYDNNYPNLSPEGHLVNIVKPGVGIAVSAADNTEVMFNRVVGNRSFGVALYSLRDSYPEGRDFNVDPDPDGNFIHHNTYADNGGELNERFRGFGVTGNGGDLFWSGRGRANGWDEITTSRYPEQLPAWSGGIAGGGGF